MRKIETLTIKGIEHLLEAMEREAYRKETRIELLEEKIEQLEELIKDKERQVQLYRQNLIAKIDGTYDEIIAMKGGLRV